jgi:hypothetical protein
VFLPITGIPVRPVHNSFSSFVFGSLSALRCSKSSWAYAEARVISASSKRDSTFLEIYGLK